MNVRAPLAALVLVTLLLAPAAALGQHGAPTPGPRPHPTPAPRPVAPRTSPDALLPRGGAAQAALPDTVLARVVFTRGQASITATDYRSGASKFQSDPDSLAPEARRQLLDLLVQQAVLDHQVGLAPPRWLSRDSANFNAYRDGVVLRAALDSAVADMRARCVARGDTVPGRGALEVMVRDSALAAIEIVYDGPAIDTLTAAFLALPQDDIRLPTGRRREILSAVPHVRAEDSTRVLGRCELGGYTVAEFLRDHASAGFFKRPTIRTSRDVRDLVNNRLYSLLLRRAGQRQHLAERRDVAALLAVRRRFLTVQRFVQNEAYDRVPLDTTAVGSYFQRESRRYDIGGTAQIVRLLFDRRAAADSAVQLLTWPGYAESLATKNVRTGIPYQTTLAEDADSLLFARVLRGGVGSVIGPDTTADGWRVFKVMTLTPRQPQTLAQSFVRARSDWLEQDGDRRVREMVSGWLASCRVTVNDSSSYLTGRAPATR